MEQEKIKKEIPDEGNGRESEICADVGTKITERFGNTSPFGKINFNLK